MSDRFEMINRVARAIDAELLKAGFGLPMMPVSGAMARAAMAAMWEPTEAMERAGAHKWDDDLCTETNALNMYQAMISEALK